MERYVVWNGKVLALCIDAPSIELQRPGKATLPMIRKYLRAHEAYQEKISEIPAPSVGIAKIQEQREQLNQLLDGMFIDSDGKPMKGEKACRPEVQFSNDPS